MESRGLLTGLLAGLCAAPAFAGDGAPTREYVYAGARLLAVSGPLPPEGPPPSIAGAAAAVAEGHSGPTAAVVTVTLSAPVRGPFVLEYTTADGTATAASGDYTPASGTVVFAPGETERPLSLEVQGDTALEPDETFLVRLATLGPATPVDVTVTIRNDDLPGLSVVGPRTTYEGPVPPVLGVPPVPRVLVAVFRVTLDAWVGPVTVGYRTEDLTATAGLDYVPASGTLVFDQPGELSREVAVPNIDDDVVEGAERYRFVLHSVVGARPPTTTSGASIIDNDSPPAGGGPVRRTMDEEREEGALP